MAEEMQIDSNADPQYERCVKSAPAIVTDIGCERTLNDDRVESLVCPSGHALLVFDGMGGEVGKPLASEISLETIRKELLRLPAAAPDVALRTSIKLANGEVHSCRSQEGLSAIGSTIVGVICKGSEMAIANVGDSRAYIVRDGAIRVLTKDHTLVQELVDAGQVPADEAIYHPQAHMLTRAIGADAEIEVDVTKYWVWDVTSGEPTDTLVLCTDGLYSMINEGELVSAVSSASPDKACSSLIDLAKERGGYDNITIVVIPLSGQLREVPQSNRLAAASSAGVIKVKEKVAAGEYAIELRSDEVQEILGQVPSWIVRWGLNVIAFCLSGLLLGSWFIKYPDTIAAPIAITSASPALSVVARANGKLTLLVKEGEKVERDSYLGAIENPASLKDVQQVVQQLAEFRRLSADPDKWSEMEFVASAELGELQAVYLDFLQNFLNFRSFVEAKYHERKIKEAEEQIANHESLAVKLAEQKSLLEKETASAEDRYNANKTLFTQKIISRSDLVAIENVYLDRKHGLVEADNRLIENKISLGNLKDSILELEQAQREEARKQKLSVRESLDRLQSAISTWEQRYILKAPVTGYVSMFKFWTDSQFVKDGEEVMMVVPKSDQIMGKLMMNERGAGKVQPGYRVRISLHSFPEKDFGVLFGEIVSISQVPKDGNYLVHVKLPNGLTSTYDKNIPFSDGMQGEGQVITEDLRLIERVFHYFRYLLGTVR